MTDATQYVISILTNAGIQSIPAFPATRAFMPLTPVAAVSVSKVDTASRYTTVLIRLLSPGGSGGALWEQTALLITQALSASGAECTQDACQYDGQTDLFEGQITAKYPGLVYDGSWNQVPEPDLEVRLNDVTVSCVTSITAKETRSLDPADLENTASNAPVWYLEMIRQPAANTAEPGGTAPFSLKILRSGKGHWYRQCYWTQITRENTPNGERQVYSGFALSRTAIT